MSRIDVIPADKGKFKVMVNFIQNGVEYGSASQANQEASKQLTHYPQATVNFIKE